MRHLAALKDEVRQAALSRRDALSPQWRAAASLDIARNGAEAIAVQGSAVVAGFLPIRSEIDLTPLMQDLAQRGVRLCLPCIVDAETIVFRAWKPGDALHKMALSTRGPANSADEVSPNIILMPLAAFDARGNRLGYGGGFYDRALARLIDRDQTPRLIGVAFACQEVAQIPIEKHDMPIMEILTEIGLRVL